MSSNQKPELEVRRQMLSQMRDSLRAQGFQAEMEVVSLSVQLANTPEEKDGLAKMIEDQKRKSENCYRSAEELSEQLAKLPKPKKEKA